ncbi:MAG: signal transduction histidine kinase with CheB and CheR, partial [Chitinophagaceae bacterium]|nr:signal transduction histidine kinase with CheB and CheR [Chitinophagaceae bacterium]
MENTKQKNKFPIVAIGASAGGLEAIIEILRHLSPDTGMAFIYIQHLDPNRKSMLTSILTNVTKMKVTEATHRMRILPDHVYIIPHNQDMSVNDDYIILNTRQPKGSLHLPIDQFFVSLAEKQKEDAIAVLLSGTAHDGTHGLKSIKLAGGITIAQDDTAKFQGMPKSAIDEGVVDLILPPADIASELDRLGKQTKIVKKVLEPDAENGPENKEIYLSTIIQLLKKDAGVDFTHYKMNTIRRRIVRRMLLHNLKTLNEYAGYLRQHREELDTLYSDLLINVTSFFRDTDTYDYLKNTLFPKILKSKTQYGPMRIWTPACSTGEEAYSLAMILIEVLGDKTPEMTVQIFATDLSEKVIAKARRGVYTRNDLLNVPPDRIQRFFTKSDGEYRIIKTIRDICVFAPQNVFRDPPFSKIDFISCCNLMIYLDTLLQKKILSTFHYALNNNGYLMLGKSETVGTSIQLFNQVEKKFRIYLKKKDVANNAMFELNYSIPHIAVTESPKLPKIAPRTMQLPPSDLEKTVNDILLKKYIPATVVINADLEILFFKGSTGLFLEPSSGKASLNLLKMARPGLEFELRNTIHKAGKSGEPIKKTGLEIKIKEIVHQVSIEVTPLKTENEERLFLIILEELALSSATVVKTSLSRNTMVQQLQVELKELREDMRSILGEQETSHEELQSANEEILSSNEELQSINEELETSKEEIESSNEELMTINTELQTRNEQLAEAHGYSEAIIGIIHEAVLVLENNFNVKTANKSFYKIFQNEAESTKGKSIFTLNKGHWNMPELRKLLENTSSQNNQVPGFEVEHNFPGIGRKVLLLNARKLVQKSQLQHLILLVIEDITEHRTAEKIIAGREAWFRNMADNAPVLIFVTDKKNKG